MNQERFKELYAIWLEPTHLHFHHGDQVEIKVMQGYAMKQGPVHDLESYQGTVLDPHGSVIPAQIALNRDKTNYVLNFTGHDEGIYTAQVENGASPHYQARLLVPVGHHVHGNGIDLNRGLEIRINNYDEFRLGDTVELLVHFQGKPLAQATVHAAYHLYEPEGFAHVLTADTGGHISFAFDAKGHWMFQTQYAENGVQYTATLVVPGVR